MACLKWLRYGAKHKSTGDIESSGMINAEMN
jgi:hypothetical protein